MTTYRVADEARGLPREPTSAWIDFLVAGAAVLWVGVLVWAVVALPERVPTQFEFGGPPTSWSSKEGTLAVMVGTTAVLALPAALVSWALFRSPASISAPNRQWWTATPARFRRFERLMREDLLLLAAVGLLLMAVAQAGIIVAAHSASGGMPPWLLPAILVPLAGMVFVIVRMTGAGGRYAEHPDLD